MPTPEPMSGASGMMAALPSPPKKAPGRGS